MTKEVSVSSEQTEKGNKKALWMAL